MRVPLLSRKKITYFIVFTCLFFLSGHSLSIVVSMPITFAVVFIGIINCFLLNNKIPKIRLSKDSWFIYLLAIALFLSTVFNIFDTPFIDVLMFLLRVLFAYYVAILIGFKDFLNIYCRTMVWLSIIAIVIFFLESFGVSVPAYSYVSLNGYTYKTIFVCTWLPQKNAVMGPFWEPGMYSSFAIFALLLESFFKDQKLNWLHIIVLCLGIYYSKSTAGYLLLIIVFYMLWAIRHKHNPIIDGVVLVLCVAGFVYSDVIFQFLIKTNENVFWKLMGGNITTNTRLYSPVILFKIFLQDPLFGSGISRVITLYNQYKPVYNIDSLTSTSAYYIGAFGIWGIGYTVFMVSGVFQQRQWSVMTKVLLLVLLLLIVNKEPHYSMCLTYLLLFYLNRNNLVNSIMTKERGESYERF